MYNHGCWFQGKLKEKFNINFAFGQIYAIKFANVGFANIQYYGSVGLWLFLTPHFQYNISLLFHGECHTRNYCVMLFDRLKLCHMISTVLLYKYYICKTQIDVQPLIDVQSSNRRPILKCMAVFHFLKSTSNYVTDVYFKWRHTS